MKFRLLAFLLIFPTFVLAIENPSEINFNEHYPFHGLAAYLNGVSFYLYDGEILEPLELNQVIDISTEMQSVLAVSRYYVKQISVHPGSKVEILEQDFIAEEELSIRLLRKDELKRNPALSILRYGHLWRPLAWLAECVESSLIFIQKYMVSSWGWALIVFTMLLKLLLIPVSVMLVNAQRTVSQVQSKLAPKLEEIKKNYDGEEAHNRLMAAHKDLGVSPFYTLKPMMWSFIQIPILIAVFNALAEMPQFVGQSLYWIKNLAYPDSIYSFGFSMPMLGDQLSLLPVIMTVVTIWSTIVFQNKVATEKEVAKQKRNLYLMAFVFFILFYPFPAVMVLYWALANTLQFVQQKFLKI